MFSILNKWLDTNTKTIHLRNIYEKDISPPTNSFKIEERTRPNSLIDTIASNNGYIWKMPYANGLTHCNTANLEMLSHLKLMNLLSDENDCTNYMSY